MHDAWLDLSPNMTDTELRAVPLRFAICDKDRQITRLRALIVQRSTKWEPFQYPSAEHMLAQLPQINPDIIFTHRHGSYDSSDFYAPTKVCKRLKAERLAGLRKGPMLFGTYSLPDDELFADDGRAGPTPQFRELAEIFDMLIARGPFEFEQFIREVCDGLRVAISSP